MVGEGTCGSPPVISMHKGPSTQVSCKATEQEMYLYGGVIKGQQLPIKQFSNHARGLLASGLLNDTQAIQFPPNWKSQNSTTQALWPKVKDKISSIWGFSEGEKASSF